MAMKGRTKCAVHGCTMPIRGPNNLCDKHRLPGAVVQVGDSDSTMVITAWAAEHGDEVGIILLNDLTLGDTFGGREGFEAKLAEQGFLNVRILEMLEELELEPAEGKKVGDWGGPWKMKYPWEKTVGHQQPN